MLILLSPAKSLDFDTPLPPGLAHTLPAFPAQARELVGCCGALRRRTGLADAHQRRTGSAERGALANFRARPGKPTRQALLAFNGDVYDGLDARSLMPLRSPGRRTTLRF
jgi:hypothetical protein